MVAFRGGVALPKRISQKLSGIENLSFVGAVASFAKNMGTTISGIASIFGMALKLTSLHR